MDNVSLFLWPVYFAYMIYQIQYFSDIMTTEPHYFFFALGFIHSSTMIKLLIQHYGKQHYQPFIQPSAFYMLALFINAKLPYYTL